MRGRRFRSRLFILIMNQPDIKSKNKLLALYKSEKERIPILGTSRFVKIGYMKGYTLEKLSAISLWIMGNSEQEDILSVSKARKKTKLAAKAMSYGILNGMKIFFFHWIYWRWIYYVRGYNYNQIEPILEEIKKKIPQESFTKSIFCMLQSDITRMSITAEEAEAIRQELLSVKEDKLENTQNG